MLRFVVGLVLGALAGAAVGGLYTPWQVRAAPAVAKRSRSGGRFQGSRAAAAACAPPSNPRRPPSAQRYLRYRTPLGPAVDALLMPKACADFYAGACARACCPRPPPHPPPSRAPPHPPTHPSLHARAQATR